MGDNEVVIAEAVPVPTNVGSAPVLSPEAADLLDRATPESTQRAYDGDWSRFDAWCADTGRVAVPASAVTVVEYVAHLAGEGKAASTVERAVAAIRTAHKRAGAVPPDTTAARAAIRTHRRDTAAAGSTTRKAQPVSVDNLRAMSGTCDPATLRGVRDRAVLVLGFALGARRSELAGLDLADVTIGADGADVVIRTSKTDRSQATPGRLSTVLHGSDPVTCPVRTTAAWITALAEHGYTSGPLFVRVDRHGRLPGDSAVSGRGSADGRVTGQAIGLIVRRAAEAAGLDPKAAWSGHSLRRGFATAAYDAGADTLRIARHAGWRDGSATLLGYVDDVDRRKKNPLIGIGL